MGRSWNHACQFSSLSNYSMDFAWSISSQKCMISQLSHAWMLLLSTDTCQHIKACNWLVCQFAFIRKSDIGSFLQLFTLQSVVSLIRCILTKKYLWLMVVFFMKKSCTYWKLIVCYGLAIVALLALCYLQTEHCLCLFDKCTYVLPCALCIW